MRLAVAALAGTVAALSPASAAERLELALAGGFAAIAREAGIDGGISQLPGPVVVVQPDGRRWRLTVTDGKLTPVPADDLFERARPSDILPDGEVTSGAGTIRRAWLTGPTDRYDHGILGDRIEASGLSAERADGRILHFQLDEASVFEDRRVRLFDLDGDGADEIIVVQSFLDAGAALAVLEANGDSLTLAAATPPIGLPHRWLNPVGAGDFDGDGRTEIAYVETPHIGGTLKLYEYGARRLRADGQASGFSNHAIGTSAQDLAAVVDWNGDGVVDFLVPDGQRRRLRIVTFAGGRFAEIERIDNARTIVGAVLAARLDTSGRPWVVYGLADGTVVALRVPAR